MYVLPRKDLVLLKTCQVAAMPVIVCGCDYASDRRLTLDRDRRPIGEGENKSVLPFML